MQFFLMECYFTLLYVPVLHWHHQISLSPHLIYNFLSCWPKLSAFPPFHLFFSSSSILKMNLAQHIAKSVFIQKSSTPLLGLHICYVGIRGRSHLLICFKKTYHDSSSSFLKETTPENTSTVGKAEFIVVNYWQCGNRRHVLKVL